MTGARLRLPRVGGVDVGGVPSHGFKGGSSGGGEGHALTANAGWLGLGHSGGLQKGGEIGGAQVGEVGGLSLDGADRAGFAGGQGGLLAGVVAGGGSGGGGLGGAGHGVDPVGLDGSRDLSGRLRQSYQLSGLIGTL